MKRILAILGVTSLPILVAATVVSFAQQPQPAPDGNIVVRTQVFQGPEGAPPPPPGADFFWVASEVGFGGRLVRGAPYSAQAVTETIQTLSDGNRIVNKVTSSLYRDSEGRTRREQTLKVLGSLGDSGEPLQTIFINDPIAGVSYALDSRTHVAHKSMPFKIERRILPPNQGVPAAPAPPPPGAEERTFEFKVEGGGEGGHMMRAPLAVPPPGAPGPGPEVFIVRTEGSGGGNYVFTRKQNGPNANEVRETLPRQEIEGVEAEGTRTTVKIPAGEIGNERPIEIVSERWYSPELQTVIMTRHSDPRFGETTYRLTNISRSEPAKSLFEVPSDYTIKEGMPAPQPARVMMPSKPRKPGNPE